MLEELYENSFKNYETIPRKISLDFGINYFIFGPPGCGKSYLVFDYLKQYDSKEYLYIDLNDLRVSKNTFVNIHAFIKENKIKILVIDNYVQEKVLLNDLDIVQKIYISQKNIQIDDDKFKYIALNSLDFEEFLLFDKSQTLQTTLSFNKYIKKGGLPFIVRAQYDSPINYYQNLIKLHFTPLEIKIIIFILKNIALKFSKFQIFNQLKKEIKISKDKFYEILENLEQSRVIFFVEKFNTKRSPLKLFFYDFGMQRGLTFTKNFVNTFKNMVFLELLKRYDEIFYLDGVDFYIPKNNRCIIAYPFASKEALDIIAQQKILSGISFVEVITTGYENILKGKKLQIEALPFWSWSLEYEN